jgi:hypothetical protein
MGDPPCGLDCNPIAETPPALKSFLDGGFVEAGYDACTYFPTRRTAPNEIAQKSVSDANHVECMEYVEVEQTFSWCFF